MTNFDLKTMTKEELDDLFIKVNKEREDRKEIEEWEDWNEVVPVLAKYLEKYGSIIVNVNDGQKEICIECDAELARYPGVITAYD